MVRDEVTNSASTIHAMTALALAVISTNHSEERDPLNLDTQLSETYGDGLREFPTPLTGISDTAWNRYVSSLPIIPSRDTREDGLSLTPPNSLSQENIKGVASDLVGEGFPGLHDVSIEYYPDPYRLDRVSFYNSHNPKETRKDTNGVGAGGIALKDIRAHGFVGIALPVAFQRHLGVSYGDAVVLRKENGEKMMVIVADTMNHRYEGTSTGDLALIPGQNQSEVSAWQRTKSNQADVSVIGRVPSAWQRIRASKKSTPDQE